MHAILCQYFLGVKALPHTEELVENPLLSGWHAHSGSICTHTVSTLVPVIQIKAIRQIQDSAGNARTTV